MTSAGLKEGVNILLPSKICKQKKAHTKVVYFSKIEGKLIMLHLHWLNSQDNFAKAYGIRYWSGVLQNFMHIASHTALIIGLKIE